jgi:Cu+-exporting ATPase
MAVTAESPHKADHAGPPYLFCSAGCRMKFLTEPQKHLAPVAPPAEPTSDAAGTVYTCPMHPEIRQDHPGNCPKCGMTLEPIMPSLIDEANPELADFTHRF